jgi:uridine kinase
MNDITITVSGPSGAGKTTIMELIAMYLDNEGFSNINIDYGADGNPRRTISQRVRCTQHVASRVNVTIKEQQALRGFCGSKVGM